MSKFANMQTAALSVPSGAAFEALPVFAGAHAIREAHVVTSPVTTGRMSVVAANDAYLAWDNRQAKSAKWSRPPRGLTL